MGASRNGCERVLSQHWFVVVIVILFRARNLVWNFCQ